MNFVDARNQLIAALAGAVGCPVVLADQVQPEQDPPRIEYSVISPYNASGSLGDYGHREHGDNELIETRAEQPDAVFSFTACSVNRTVKVKGSRRSEYVFGDDEAQRVAESAQGWLLHGGYDIINRIGFVVVEILDVGSRTTLEVDEAARRYGFDARLRYTRTDERVIGAIGNIPNINAKKE